MFKGFQDIDKAIAFLIAAKVYNSCCKIPIYDDTNIPKFPKDFGHNCGEDKPCVIERIDYESFDKDEQTALKNLVETDNDEEETNVKELATEDDTTDLETVEPVPFKKEVTKPQSNDQNCTENCKNKANEYMIQCDKCNKWTHYICTALPAYQLYMLTNTSRKYRCRICSNVPKSFESKWEKPCSKPLICEGTQSSIQSMEKHESTLDIVTKIQESVVSAITSIHEKSQDEKIIDLQEQLKQKQDTSKAINKCEEKLNKLFEVSAESTKEMKYMAEKVTNSYESGLQKMESLSNALENASKRQENYVKKLNKLHEDVESCSKTLEIVSRMLTQNTDTNKNITDNLERMQQMIDNSTKSKSLHESQPDDNPKSRFKTENRFAPLLETTKEDEQKQRKTPLYKKALIIGNSQIKNIKTENFLQNCLVHKYVAFASDEMLSKLSELDEDYESIYLHVFTNDVRNNTPEECVDIYDELVVKLQQHCRFANIILSLPFPTVSQVALNEKMLKCGILLKYKYIDSQKVKVTETHGLVRGNVAIRQFFDQGGVHLSKQGTNIFVSNIKFNLRKSLNIANPRKHPQEQPQKQKRNMVKEWNDNQIPSFPFNSFMNPYNVSPMFNHGPGFGATHFGWQGSK